MDHAGSERVADIFALLGCKASVKDKGLAVTAPGNGEAIASLAMDGAASVAKKTAAAVAAQQVWRRMAWSQRTALLEGLAAAIRDKRNALAELITLEAGKTRKEAQAETDSSADVLVKTIKDATLPELNGMLRRKERVPVGVVGLITSFNFPLVVANWTIGPALLAGNGVVWKPSEKTPLTALAYKAVFDHALPAHKDLLQVIIGGREAGQALVANESIDMISATGSVGMGVGIKATLVKKKNNAVPPILELGGNNGVIISDHLSEAQLDWSVQSLLNSFLGTTGQRCTNTRRLIVHKNVYGKVIELLKQKLEAFIASGVIKNPLDGESNEYGYGPLIDEEAFQRFEKARRHVQSDGGKIYFGQRLLEEDYPHAYYVEPAIAALQEHSALMQEETFAPLLFVVPYSDMDEAIALVNTPANAGLVGGIYTQSQREADDFAARNEAGHSVINSPKGTGTPAYGMGFGGNKDSGEGEILNSADPLQAFTRPGKFSRVAQYKDVAMDRD